jgi:hypothetical protein
MKNNEAIININDKIAKNGSIPKLNYYYEIFSQVGWGLGCNVHSIENLCNRVKNSLKNLNLEEKGLTIILKSEITQNSPKEVNIIDQKYLKYIKKGLSGYCGKIKITV